MAGLKFTIDEIPAPGKSPAPHVVCLGAPAGGLPGDASRLTLLDPGSEETMAEAASLNPALFAHGLVVCTSSKAFARHPREVVRLQKLLAFLHTKFVAYPKGSAKIPDPLNLRDESQTHEYSHELNRLRNMPLLLDAPLAEKLAAARIGLPALICMPGPSLAGLGPHIRDIAKGHLVIAIARTLPFLRAHGVTPDIVVQLDTHPGQRHFYAPGDDFSHSVLIALSLAPVSAIAARFFRVFFMESFDLVALPNPYRMRESWLSSLLSCLGAAETAHAPRVLMAGCDLSFRGNDVYCTADKSDDRASCPPAEPHHGPMELHGGKAILADNQGRRVHTRLGYLATAVEAELFAADIARTTGAAFFNLSREGILSPEAFPFLSPEEAASAPAIDREAFLGAARSAYARKERVDFEGLFREYDAGVRRAALDRTIMSCLKVATNEEATAANPYFRYVAAQPLLAQGASRDDLLDAARRLTEKLHDACELARAAAAMHLAHARGQPVPVLCLGEEEAELSSRLARFRPDFEWRFVGLRDPGTSRPAPSSGAIAVTNLSAWLSRQAVALLSRGVREEYGYAYTILERPNVVLAESLPLP